jgi:DNA-binding transcriptional regulator YdaS (Cro superfamily)
MGNMGPPHTPQVRTLHRALEILGSEQRLAATLGVALTQLAQWLRGECDVPAKAFFAALDIVARGFTVPRA